MRCDELYANAAKPQFGVWIGTYSNEEEWKRAFERTAGPY